MLTNSQIQIFFPHPLNFIPQISKIGANTGDITIFFPMILQSLEVTSHIIIYVNFIFILFIHNYVVDLQSNLSNNTSVKYN